MLPPTQPRNLALRVCAALLLVLIQGCALLPGGSMSPERIFERTVASVVRVDGRGPRGESAGIGSGFSVAPGLIATSLHVVDGVQQVSVLSREGERFPVLRVIAIDEPRDLVILQIGSIDIDPLELADSDELTSGERLYAIGNPSGIDFTISEGLFSGRLRSPEGPGYDILNVSLPLSPGSSGSPLLNARGQVVGVATAVVRTGQSLGLGVPSNALRALRAGASGRGVSFEEFAQSRTRRGGVAGGRTQGGRVRQIPRHPDDFVATCEQENLREVVVGIVGAIDKGAAIYNNGDPESCYRIYEGAALKLVRELPDTCAGARTALDAGLKRAETIESYDDKAWAMRDAFDGLLDVIGRRERSD